MHVQRCDNDIAKRKFAALRAHTSQTAGLIERVGAKTFEKWWGEEAFAAAI